MLQSGDQLAQIPTIFRGFFRYKSLNSIQTRCFNTIYVSNENAVISAPTGSGKTAVMELAMMRQFQADPQRSKKIVYIAPSKALCNERFNDWNSRMHLIYRKCALITGDSEFDDDLNGIDLVVTTPEKWDVVTRRWSEMRNFLESISLIILDEVHILNEARGAALEVLVSRMRLMLAKTGLTLRYIAASATIPNPEDLCRWLSDFNGNSATCLKFTEGDRAIPLNKYVYSAPLESRNPYTFDMNLNNRLPKIIRNHSNGQPTLVFCNTRKSAEITAQFLAKNLKISSINRFNVTDSKLQECICASVAFHHAGLSPADRNKIESLFREGQIKVLCATSTLAAGVNLPAHLVIIKSTMQYGPKGYQEYSELDIFQMMGRAGRPQYDTFGVAAIITDDSRHSFYEKLCQANGAIESSLKNSFVEHLNSEIVLGNVRNLEEGLLWLKSTYYYVRAIKNPEHYLGPSIDNAERYLLNHVSDAVRVLESNDLLRFTEHNMFRSTQFGSAMSRFCLDLESTSRYISTPKAASASKILQILSKSHEFIDIKFASGDKGIINQILKENKVRFKETSGKIKEIWEKIFYSIQIVLGDINISGAYSQTFNKDASHYCAQAFKLCKGLVEILHIKRDGIALRNALEILSCLGGKTWHDSSFNLKQLDKIGKSMSAALFQAGIQNLQELAVADGRRIEHLVDRRPPFGNEIVADCLANVPLFSATVTSSDGLITAEFSLTNRDRLLSRKYQAIYMLILTQRDRVDEIAYFSRSTLDAFLKSSSWKAEISTRSASQVTVSVISDSYSGVNQHIVLDQADSRAEMLPETREFCKPHVVPEKRTRTTNMVAAKTLYKNVENGLKCHDIDESLFNDIDDDFDNRPVAPSVKDPSALLTPPTLFQESKQCPFQPIERKHSPVFMAIAKPATKKLPSISDFKSRKQIYARLQAYKCTSAAACHAPLIREIRIPIRKARSIPNTTPRADLDQRDNAELLADCRKLSEKLKHH